MKSAAAIHDRLGHPVIDIDGHVVEFMPFVGEYLREALGPSRFEAYRRASQWSTRSAPTWPSLDELRARRPARYAWWGLSANTLDRATAMLPGLLHERLGELGIDYTVLYPTVCLGSCAIDDDQMRQGVCRGYNTFAADTSRAYGDRLTLAGIVPMDTPEEAITELAFCKEAGLKVVAIPHGVFRRVKQPQQGWWLYRTAPRTVWFDTFGLDSEHDYDPVWRKFVELGFAVTSHNGLTYHASTYTSPTNYSHNHVGAHADAMAMLCRSLYFGGVTRRFPQLAFGFLECGVAWAAAMLSSLVEHYEKRNAAAIAARDPAAIDVTELERYFRSHGTALAPAQLEHLGELLRESVLYTNDAPPPELRDDWAHVAADRVEDVVARFVEPFYFGCEADDRTVAHAFSDVNPSGARLKPCFSSDLGHWDVERMDNVVAEAYELVEDGLLEEDELRAFLFENPAQLFLRSNPDFFVGTQVEHATHSLLAGRARSDP